MPHDGFEGGEQAGVESVHGVKAHLSVAKICFLVIGDKRQQDSCLRPRKRKPALPDRQLPSPAVPVASVRTASPPTAACRGGGGRLDCGCLRSPLMPRKEVV
ncbi:hypothetical protein GCM10010425_30410 [Streptomyces spororaveus]|uniref:Uncharacterized protein n=1 Tax=Streptomyces spororaveus TaxID=284039 RepID=A0ABQ3T678_9ACTN|nr:hypothetical protein Sspor_14250 [Streptomyces spororaveus]